jgi:hypothetical protein
MGDFGDNVHSSKDGGLFRGSDRKLEEAGTTYVSSFHLHPAISARLCCQNVHER